MIRIRVPATSANIGPGFDCLSIAFNIYNTFEFEETDGGLVFNGVKDEFNNEKNLIYTAMKELFHKVGYTTKGLKINVHSNIPISRGLGSSATCILGGLLGANEIAGGRLSKHDILEIATDMEGHPDNLSSALLGGMTVSIKDGKGVHVEKLKISDVFGFTALIPEFSLSTETSRKVLPKNVPHKDAVFNIGRTLVLISGLQNGNPESVRIGCEDRIHQIYRSSLIKDYEFVTTKCKELGAWGTFLSGAGPTIMTITPRGDNKFPRTILKELNASTEGWKVLPLTVNDTGSIIE